MCGIAGFIDRRDVCQQNGGIQSVDFGSAGGRPTGRGSGFLRLDLSAGQSERVAVWFA